MSRMIGSSQFFRFHCEWVTERLRVVIRQSLFGLWTSNALFCIFENDVVDKVLLDILVHCLTSYTVSDSWKSHHLPTQTEYWDLSKIPVSITICFLYLYAYRPAIISDHPVFLQYPDDLFHFNYDSDFAIRGLHFDAKRVRMFLLFIIFVWRFVDTRTSKKFTILEQLMRSLAR